MGRLWFQARRSNGRRRATAPSMICGASPTLMKRHSKRNLNHVPTVYGASMVSSAAIQWAKARDCTIYDMWGIPDADEATLEAQFESRSDGLWGVYGFKRGDPMGEGARLHHL